MVSNIPPDRQPETYAELCKSAARKAEELDIDPAQLLPDCETE